MCNIAVAQCAGDIPRDLLQNAFDHNSDGWGIMFAQGGRVIAMKEKAGINRFFETWDKVPRGIPVATHFRFGTSGPKSDLSCHPFQVLSKDQCGMDLWVMHNGVLSQFSGDKERSDTMEMVEDVLSPLLKGQPGFVRHAAFAKVAEGLIGHGNKLVFLEGAGKWHFINQELGSEINGVWYSNEYSLKPVYSGHGKGKAAGHYEPYKSDGFEDYHKQWDEWDAQHGYNGQYGSSAGKTYVLPAKKHYPVVVTARSPLVEVKAIQVPVRGGAVADMSSEVDEKALLALSNMGGVPRAREDVAQAIEEGATLADSEDTLQTGHGVSLRAFTDFFLTATSYILGSAKGNLEGVRDLRNKAFNARYPSLAANMEHASDAPIETLAQEARQGEPAVIKSPIPADENAPADDWEQLADAFWTPENLRLLDPHNIEDACGDDYEGAAAFIIAMLERCAE